MEYLERTGWCTRPHVGGPLRDAERRRDRPARRGRRRRGPLPEQQPDPVVGHRSGGPICAPPAWRVGLGVDGSSSADSASLWLEARQAMLLAKLRDGAPAGTARMALEMRHARAAPACLGRSGEIGVLEPGAVADVAVWRLDRAGVRRRARRPDRGLAALRPGGGVAHDRQRAIRRARRATSCTTISTTCLRTHARHAARIQRLAD